MGERKKLAVFIPIAEDDDDDDSSGTELRSDGTSSSASRSSSTSQFESHEFMSSPFGFGSPKPLVQVRPDKYSATELDCESPTAKEGATPRKTARGSQGKVFFDCPKPGLVLKQTPFVALQRIIGNLELAYDIFLQQCLVQNLLNELPQPNAFVVTDSCWFTGSNESGQLHTVQEQVTDGTTIRAAVGMDSADQKASSSMTIRVRTDPAMAQLLLDVLDAIHLLYQHGLFHNDMHAGNVLLQPPAAEARQRSTKTETKSATPRTFRVRVIDYGLMTYQFALDKDYRRIDDDDDKFPWLDFAHFVHDVARGLPRAQWPRSLAAMVQLLLGGRVINVRDRASVPLVPDSELPRFDDVHALLQSLSTTSTGVRTGTDLVEVGVKTPTPSHDEDLSQIDSTMPQLTLENDVDY